MTILGNNSAQQIHSSIIHYKNRLGYFVLLKEFVILLRQLHSHDSSNKLHLCRLVETDFVFYKSRE